MAIAKIIGSVVVQIDKTTDVAPNGWKTIDDTVVVGWIDNHNGTFDAPTKSAEEVLAEERAEMLVSRFQARAAIYNAGLLPAVEALMIDPPTPQLIIMAWEDAEIFRRLSPAVELIGTGIGLTDLELDQLFRDATVIEV